MEATLQRKLTTIVVADVAGSSRLMGLDEEGTHARLAGLGRELISPAIEAHGGTLVKKTGDGFLAEFPSVVEAIRCATEIRKASRGGTASCRLSDGLCSAWASTRAT